MITNGRDRVIAIIVKPVTKKDWFPCTRLEVSEENGKRFVVPIVYSLAESKFEPHLEPLAIYAKRKPIERCASN